MLVDMAKELKKTLHIHSDELPWVQTCPGLESRFLQARVKDDFYVTQLRAQPGAVTALHRHPVQRGIGGFTLKGAWGHDKRYLYRPGTYIFETPGVVHQFFNGPEVTEVVFFGEGISEFVNPGTLEVTSRVTAEMALQQYLDYCEERGVKPHYLT